MGQGQIYWQFMGPEQPPGFRISLFFDFLDFLDFSDFFFLFFWVFWAREGSGRVQGCIWIHMDKVSAQMEPFWTRWGPFSFSDFLETHLGPK